MGCTSSDLQPQELIEFRKLNTPTTIENVEIPARPESRTVTDKKGFICFGIFILLVVPLLIYGLTMTDLRHLYYPTDACGNFCGLDNDIILNDFDVEVRCSGQNYINKPYLDGNQCSNTCKHGVVKTGEIRRCVDLETESLQIDTTDTFADARKDGWKFFITILITIGLSVLTLVALRYAPASVVWGTLIFSVVILFVITGGLWYFYTVVSEPRYGEFSESAQELIMTVASIWTLISLIILLIILVLIKKIGLIIQLYKEAVKVLAAMPMLVVVTLLLTVVQFIILGIFYVTSFYLSFALDLYYVSFQNKKGHFETHYEYLHSPLLSLIIFLNLVITLWTMHFVAGIQYMIISGSVARWFFTKNKQYLESPILTSTKVVLKYHLGTVAFGSMLIMLFSVVKAILRTFCRNVCCRCCFVKCCSPVEIILKFISENSYIQTAIHGQSFCKSAKRAIKLLLSNAKSVAAVNCIGDFVVAMIIFIVSVIATAISFLLFKNLPFSVALVLTFVCLLINIIIVSLIFATFQAIVDTLLLCFCEDQVLNDGISRPYYMSRGLMEFVENSKKIYG